MEGTSHQKTKTKNIHTFIDKDNKAFHKCIAWLRLPHPRSCSFHFSLGCLKRASYMLSQITHLKNIQVMKTNH